MLVPLSCYPGLFSTESRLSAFVTPLKSPLMNIFISFITATSFVSVYFRWSADPGLPLKQNSSLAPILKSSKREDERAIWGFKKTKSCKNVSSRYFSLCFQSLYLFVTFSGKVWLHVFNSTHEALPVLACFHLSSPLCRHDSAPPGVCFIHQHHLVLLASVEEKHTLVIFLFGKHSKNRCQTSRK